MTANPVLDVLEEIIEETVEPAAADVDATGAFPRAAVSALGTAGLLGLMSATDVGGKGAGLGDAVTGAPDGLATTAARAA